MSPLRGFSAISDHLLRTRASTLLAHELSIAGGSCPTPKAPLSLNPLLHSLSPAADHLDLANRACRKDTPADGSGCEDFRTTLTAGRRDQK